jgi:hypothetical protein
MFGACAHGPVLDASPVTICAYVRFAGAIGSLKWKGIEFIDHHDHGRELQTAVTYDDLGEGENPTEAGAVADRGAPISSSLLLGMKAAGATLTTTARMAFWKPFHGARLSSALLSKKVTIGWHGLPNVIQYDVALKVAETHSRVAFEALTAYMPASFGQFYTYHARHLTPLPSPSGNLAMAHQPQPIIVLDQRHGVAMGIFSADSPKFYASGVFAGYGVSKWSVFFEETPAPAASTYSHEILLAVGTLPEVEHAMDAMEAPMTASAGDNAPAKAGRAKPK